AVRQLDFERRGSGRRFRRRKRLSHVEGYRFSWFDQGLGSSARRNTSLDQRVVWGHLYEIETVDEVAQHLQLLTKGATPATRLRSGVLERAVFTSCDERVVEIVVEPATREDELPGLASIEHVIDAAEPGLIVTDHLVERVVHRD